MSAIAGIYYRDGQRVDRADLERMVESVAHRGPDGAGLWSDRAVGIGHRMLWTTPESLRERLPLVSQNGDLVLTADARIDNRDELIHVLGLTDRPAAEVGDSDLILAAYERWDEGCLEKLLGDFAFAIWDGRRQRMFCARDVMGVKPLYYYHADRVFVFASELKGLLSLPQVPRRLNEVMVASYLVRVLDDKTITFYRDILRLPAGHNMRVDRDGIRIRPYGSPDLSREVRFRTDEEYAEALRDHFTEAVRCRLRSAFPVGSFLSGGLDSSSIACTARNLLAEGGARRLHTFSAIFPDLPEQDLPRIDERRYINAVLATGGFTPHWAQADRLSPLLDLDDVFWHADEAVLAPNLYINWALYGAAQQEGVRVLLDGIDGDSVVSYGMEYLPALARTGRWRSLLAESGALAEKYGLTRRQVIRQLAVRPLVPERLLALRRALRGSPQPTWGAGTVINADFARRIGLVERIRALQVRGGITARASREQHWRGITSGLLAYVLEVADKAASAFAVEPRYPFFDRRLVEFCISVPPAQRLRQGWTRWVMRRAMEGILPPEVQWRESKSDLGPSFKRRLLDYERATLDEVILTRPQIIEEYVDVAALRAAYERYTARPVQSEQEALNVYSAVILARWLHRSQVSA